MLYLTLKDDPFSEQDYDENDLLEVCSCVPTASQPSPLLLCCRNDLASRNKFLPELQTKCVSRFGRALPR